MGELKLDQLQGVVGGPTKGVARRVDTVYMYHEYLLERIMGALRSGERNIQYLLGGARCARLLSSELSSQIER
jgi:hypothetical protein